MKIKNIKWYCTDGCEEEIDSPVVGIAIYFEDGDVYNENIEYDDDEIIEEYIKDLIKEKGWTNVEDYGWGYFCPFCLQIAEEE